MSGRFIALQEHNGRALLIPVDRIVLVEERADSMICAIDIDDGTDEGRRLFVGGSFDGMRALLNGTPPAKAHPNAIGWELTPEHPSNLHPSNRTAGPPAWAPKSRAMEVQP